MSIQAIRFLTGLLLVGVIALMGQACISKVKDDRYKPAQRSAALEALGNRNKGAQP